jgi:hypothetical protein
MSQSQVVKLASNARGTMASFGSAMFVRRAVVALLLVGCASCASHDTDVVFYIVDGYRFSSADRRAIQQIADATAIEVRQLLPALPARLTLRVRAGKKVMPETGASGESNSPDVVYWTVDPGHQGGVSAIVKTYLRQTLFHEFHHLVRGSTAGIGIGTTFFERAITEGLATAFERDFASGTVPWGAYPEDVAMWVAEIRGWSSDASREAWLSRHPERRRWLSYKVGTYLVDRAMNASGRSSADLVSVSTDEILRMASEPRVMSR